MNAIERALRDFLSARPPQVGIAVVGGIAVSVRTEPRFTRDIDFAVAVESDADAETYLVAMKLVIREDEVRPRDREDLVQLAAVADAEEWARAARAVEMILERGFARGRDLRAELAAWRDRGGS